MKLLKFKIRSEDEDCSDDNTWLMLYKDKGRMSFGFSYRMPILIGCGVYFLPYRSVIHGSWRVVMYGSISFVGCLKYRRLPNLSIEPQLECEHETYRVKQ